MENFLSPEQNETNSSTLPPAIISVTAEEENTNGNSQTKAALVEAYVV